MDTSDTGQPPREQERGPAQPNQPTRATSGRNAVLVGAGIVLSRLSGVIREGFLAAYLGTRSSADAFSAALRIPKLLQNLLGEGALSASFIPVYSQVLKQGDERRAGHVAGAVAGLLTLLTAGLVLIATLAARPLASVIAPGFAGQKHELTVYLIRIVTPGVGFLVLSAWCLGVLNAHRRFFLSYVAPVLWNTAIIAGLAIAGVRAWAETNIAEAAAWGVLIGGALQFLVQLPAVRSLVPHLRITFSTRAAAVRVIMRRFTPAVAGRGVVTLGNYADLILASLLATGAVAVLDRAQVLYLLPISVFAVSVAAAELPELSRENSHSIAHRLSVGTERVLLFLMFCTMAFIFLGVTIVKALYERVSFTADDTLLVAAVLAAYSLGMVPTGLSRLLQNACYGVGDVVGPARISVVRLSLSVAVGLMLMFQFDRIVISDGTLYDVGNLPAFGPLDGSQRLDSDFRHLGPLGLALGSMLGAWVEFALLKRRIRQTLAFRVSFGRSVLRLLPPAIVAAILGVTLAVSMSSAPAIAAAVVVLSVSGMTYLLAANIMGHPVSRSLFSPLRRALWGR